MGDLDRLSDRHEIEKLKAGHFRFVDTKQWPELRDLFTDDMTFYVDDTPTFDNADALMGYFASCHPDRITVHHGHMPEIAFTGEDTATGIWALSDCVDDPGKGTAFQGFAHFHDRYVRGADGRLRIAESRLTRLRVEPVRR